MQRWHLGDGSAGLFFLCLSVGSSGGALLARGALSRALAIGCALVAAGALLLVATLTGALLAVSALYGCGLGLSMTSISLLRSRQRPAHRVSEMARLNLTWAVGAGFGPPLLLKTAFHFGSPAVLHVVASIFFVSAILVLLIVPAIPRLREPTGLQGNAGWLHSLRVVPVILLCMIPLATGVESGMSSWLSSYIMRGGYVSGVTISATTAFGTGLILSRFLQSRQASTRTLTGIALRVHPVLIVLGIALLMISRHPLLSVAAAFITGLGVGPLYPLVLALLLNHSEAGNAGFLAGGIGASVVPMITGAVSGWTHSLRTGLGVLLIGAILILIAGTRLTKTGNFRN